MSACWICDSPNTLCYITFNSWKIRRCKVCGFRYAVGGTQLVLGEHYSQDYFTPLTQRDMAEKWTHTYQARIDFVLSHAPSRRVLEAGAGSSRFAMQAAASGLTVHVVDGSPWSVKTLTSEDGITGEVADLNALALCPQSFGAIHSAHVLEHLTNPRGFLRECFQALQPGGVLCLSFPAYEPWILGIKDTLYRLRVVNFPYNYQAPDHVSYFDSKCIQRVLRDIGFEIRLFERRKFISLQQVASQIAVGGPVRKALGRGLKAAALITKRIGFHRDLEILAVRPR